MKFTPSIEYVIVDKKEELAVMIYAHIDEGEPIKEFVGKLIHNFVNHKMVSSPQVAILGVRIQGVLDAEQFIAEWKTQLAQNKVAMVFYERLTVVDATYESADGKVTDLDIII